MATESKLSPLERRKLLQQWKRRRSKSPAYFGFFTLGVVLLVGAHVPYWPSTAAPATVEVALDGEASPVAVGGARELSTTTTPSQTATPTATPSPTGCTPSPTEYETSFLWEDPLIQGPWDGPHKYQSKDAKDKLEAQKPLVILHIMCVCWMFIALMIVCDCFFCPALTEMVEHWNVKEDVAGATFMAAGGSAPELFTSIMGVFMAKSDVGFGTIVGSAVFNVLFVIGLCAVCSGADMPLTWWPLFRDCTYYIVGLLVLAICVADDEVKFYEAAILFLLYVGYVTVMYFNEKLEVKVKDALAKYRGGKVNPETVKVEQAKYAKEAAEKLEKGETGTATTAAAPPSADAPAGPDAGAGGGTGAVATDAGAGGGTGAVAMDPEGGGGDDGEKKEGEEKEGDDGDEWENPWEWPESKGEQVLFVIAFPLKVALYGTVYDCANPKYKEKFIFTFFCSLIWIAVFSYFMVFSATVIGAVAGITPVVMGLTFLAAGTSIPDALSSVYMAKMGEGDMAISSSIGSNVFDILIGLPVPWMLGMAVTGNDVIIKSPFVVVDVVLLLFMVMMVVGSIAHLGWKLDMRLGYIMGGLYGIFLFCALMLEIGNMKGWGWVEAFKPRPFGEPDIGDDGC